MTRSLTLALLMAIPAFALAQDKKDDKPKFDAEKVLGDWKITEGMKAGDKSDKMAISGKVTITKDKISYKAGDMAFVFGFKADHAKDPIAVDLEILEPEGLKGAKALGIVKLDGEKLTLCYNPAMGGARPTKFESTKDNGFYMFVHEKAKKGEKKDDK